MKKRKFLSFCLAGALCLCSVFGGTVGGVLTASAAEFDTAWYAQQNPDVVAQVGSSREALLRHYNSYGRKEGRMANANDSEAQLRRLFNAEDYAAAYPDIRNAFGNDGEAMFRHYLAYGILERRRPSVQVPYEAAVELRDTVVKALAGAGIEAKPGSPQVVAAITGETQGAGGNAAAGGALNAAGGVAPGGETMRQALAQVQAVVGQAVSNTVYAAANQAGDDDGDDDEGEPEAAQEPVQAPAEEPEPVCSEHRWLYVDESEEDEDEIYYYIYVKCLQCGEEDILTHAYDCDDCDTECYEYDARYHRLVFSCALGTLYFEHIYYEGWEQDYDDDNHFSFHYRVCEDCDYIGETGRCVLDESVTDNCECRICTEEMHDYTYVSDGAGTGTHAVSCGRCHSHFGTGYACEDGDNDGHCDLCGQEYDIQ